MTRRTECLCIHSSKALYVWLSALRRVAGQDIYSTDGHVTTNTTAGLHVSSGIRYLEAGCGSHSLIGFFYVGWVSQTHRLSVMQAYLEFICRPRRRKEGRTQVAH